MKRAVLFYIFVFSFINFVNSQEIKIKAEPLMYLCKRVEIAPLIDGVIDDEIWNSAAWTDLFIDISGPDFPIPKQLTKAKMLWNDSNLFIAAYIQESDLWATLTDDESIIFYDNDFEVFIDPDGDNHQYFEFEFNSYNTKWDLYLPRPYRDITHAEHNWNAKGLKSAVKLYGSINQSTDTDSCWTIEIVIPFSSLKHKGNFTITPNIGDNWRVNFSRVEWDLKFTNNTYEKFDKPEHNWVWSPQWAINMHRPEYWGYLYFVDSTNISVIPNFDWEIENHLMNIYEQQKISKANIDEFLSKSELAKFIDTSKVSYKIFDGNFNLSYSVDNQHYNVNNYGRYWKYSYNDSLPKFWVWLHNNLSYNLSQWDSVFYELDKIGVQGVLLNAPADKLKEILPIASFYNLKIDAWIWTLNRGDAPDSLLSVNALDSSLAQQKAYVDYYKFLSPALVSTYNFVDSIMIPYRELKYLHGIHFDYIRYVDVILPIALQPKYGLLQNHIIPRFDYGYHPLMIAEFKKKYKRTDIDANDSLWIQFRMDKITDLVYKLKSNNTNMGLLSSAAVFPDVNMAPRMVRQDWKEWNLDYYFPMLYNNFYSEPIDWIRQEMKINQINLPNSKIIAGLYLPALQKNGDLHRAMMAAFEGGAYGIALFDYRAMTQLQKMELKRFIKNEYHYLGKPFSH